MKTKILIFLAVLFLLAGCAATKKAEYLPFAPKHRPYQGHR